MTVKSDAAAREPLAPTQGWGRAEGEAAGAPGWAAYAAT